MKKFEYTPPEQPRELILKLGQKITDRIGHTVTASIQSTPSSIVAVTGSMFV